MCKPVVSSLKPEFMTAEEVMARLSKTPHPRDLQDQIYSDNVVKALVEWIVRSGALRDHEVAEDDAERIALKLEFGSELPAPKMDEVYRAKEEVWAETALVPLNKMASSGKFKMWGIHIEDHYGIWERAPGMPKKEAQYRQIDSHLFWRGQHFINDCGQVVTFSGNAVYGKVQFLTKEVEAFLAPAKKLRKKTATLVRPLAMVLIQVAAERGRDIHAATVEELRPEATRRAGLKGRGTSDSTWHRAISLARELSEKT